MVIDSEQAGNVLSVRKFESGPPPPPSTPPEEQLVNQDGDLVLATSKQEEWITKKKTELVTTKQIETRVKRQVVLEDGKVVEDSGPLVTTTTTEDTDKNESEQTEHKEHGGDVEPGEGWVAIETTVPEDAVVKEMNERKITTHDEVEDVLETEEVRHLGDVSSEKLVRAIREGSGDTRKAFLAPGKSELVALSPYERDTAAQRRVVHQSRRHDRKTDIEDMNEVSKINEKGNLVTEITKRHEHEDFHNEDIPDSDSDEFEHIEDQEGTRDYSHAKNENYIEYMSVPKGAPLSHGVKIGEATRLVAENVSGQRQGDDDLWDSVSERIRKSQGPDREEERNKLGTSRSDALTSKPLDFSQEEHTRKNETNRWLSSHFGSSSSSLNSETSPRSPLQPTPQAIRVTMTSRSSPILTSPPPPPPPIPGKGGSGKRITFQDSPSPPPPRPSPAPKDVKFDLKNRHESVMRSLNSQFGRSSLTKSGSDWEETPTPTPPPRTRRRNSPDIRNVRTPDHFQTSSPIQGSNTLHSMKMESDPYPLQKSNDLGERKSFERREESFGYTGSSQPVSRASFEAGNFGDGYVTKHNNYYKTTETNNPSQNELYANGNAEVTERKTVEKREQNFSYNGPSQKQFHPKYILGIPASTASRLKGIEGTGVIEEEVSRHSQSLPRRRFYFGDEEGSLGNKHPPLEPKRSAGYGKPKELRSGGSDDINVSISNNYSTLGDIRKTSSLNRSMSFTPASVRDRPSRFSSNMDPPQQTQYVYKSNSHVVDSADLQSPRLINIMSRSVRDVNSPNPTWTMSYKEKTPDSVYSNRYDAPLTSNYSRSKRTFLDNSKKNSTELYEPMMSRPKAASPSRSMTPTTSFSPMSRAVATRTLSGGKNSPGTSDDYQETYRMTSSTPDNDETHPRITTDTTSKFSKRTLRNDDGQPAGKVESSETTTRTKSRFTESEVLYPSGRRVDSPLSYRASELKPQRTTDGGVIISVRDPNNNRHVHYAK